MQICYKGSENFNTNQINFKKMTKLGEIVRFESKKILELENQKECFRAEVECVKDNMLRKKWYNVTWHHYPHKNTPFGDMFKFRYAIKSTTYKNEKEAIQHFNEIIKSLLRENKRN